MQDDGHGGAAKPAGQRWSLRQRSMQPRLRALQDVANIADALMSGLDAAMMRHRKGASTNERMAAGAALMAVHRFIMAAAQRVEGPKRHRTLATALFVRSLAHALVQLDRGVVAPVFKPGHKWDKPPLPHSIREARANAAAAMHALIQAGFPAGTAAQFVAEEIAGRPELHGIKRPAHEAVARWRQDMMARMGCISLHQLGDTPDALLDVAVFAMWADYIQEVKAAGRWSRAAAANWAKLHLLTVSPPFPK